MPEITDNKEKGTGKPNYAEIIQKLCLFDDCFMSAVFEDIRLVELMLRIILDKPDLKVIRSKTQYNIKNLYGRSVRLDILATDSSGKIYNIEVQRDESGAIPERARYNSSLMDSHIEITGKELKSLPETYVIFITEHDYFKRGKPLYKIERINLGTGELFNDGAHIIYVNGDNRDDTDLGKLMADFASTDPKQFHYRELAKAVNYYKNNQEGVHYMSGISEELFNMGVKQGVEQGIKQGNEDGRKIVAENLIKYGKLSIEEISALSNLSLEKVKELAEKLSA